MSRYVRSYDGYIVDLNTVTPLGYRLSHYREDEAGLGFPAGWYWVSKEFGVELLYKDSDIVDQADAIEELCDCYLEDCGKGTPATITKDMFANPTNSIWVDLIKGKVLRKEIAFYACVIKRDSTGTLIRSIAKMNEKGEFELL